MFLLNFSGTGLNPFGIITHNTVILRTMVDAIEVEIQSDYIPTYAHVGDAGADLRSSEAHVLKPGERKLIKTGVSIALPVGYAAFIVPRSGLAAKHGITIVNSPGTVDAGYRGEIMVTLLNTDSTNSFEIAPGDRIAQMVIQQVVQAKFVPVDSLSYSERGSGGFGSSGVS